jgi:hypothetical protein
MSTPDDNARKSGNMSFAGHEVADTAFVEPPTVVDDEDVPRARGRDALEEYICAASMPGGTRSARDSHTSANGAQVRWSQPNRQLEHRTPVSDEWRCPFEVVQQGLDHVVPPNWRGVD